MLKEGGVAINKEKVTEDFSIHESLLLNGKYILVQKGKKNYYLVKAV
jgi:tyrosyl-tRNA synthetase